MGTIETSTSEGGVETVDKDVSGARPSLEKFPVNRLLLMVQLHDWVLSHASADGWTDQAGESKKVYKGARDPLISIK